MKGKEYVMELQRIVELANSNAALMDGTTGPVVRILNAADVVWAVWQDFEAPNGVSTLLLKGENALKEIVIEGQPRELRCNAVQVNDINMAIAARATLGSV